MPAQLSRKNGSQALYPALALAARELASDNIMCAVMLTGVLFLQASLEWSSLNDTPSLPSGWSILLETLIKGLAAGGDRGLGTGSHRSLVVADQAYINTVQGVDGAGSDGIKRSRRFGGY